MLYDSRSSIRDFAIKKWMEKVRGDEEVAAQAAEQGKEYVRKYHESMIGGPTFEKWYEEGVERAINDKRLMTEQQYADWRAGRHFQVGDRARYIGPQKMELTQSGKYVQRQTGQTGHISHTERTYDGSLIFTFMPDVPPEVLEPGGPDLLVADAMVREYTEDFLYYERIPEPPAQVPGPGRL